MPMIGRPQDSRPNPFANIKKSNAKTDREIIAAATGQNPAEASGVKYVDQKEHNKMGKDEFMRLLTTQLQNQDPTNPMDPSKFTGELAQFAQLEQLSNLNTKFESMGGAAPSQNKFMAASFLGKKVYSHGTSVEYTGTPTTLNFFLDKKAERVQVRLFDEKGNMVSEQVEEQMGRGPQTLYWDGLQLDNAPAVKGRYTLQVKAWDDKSQEIPVKTQSAGVVNAVTFDKGETVLIVEGGKKVYLRDVDRFEVVSGNNAKTLQGN